MKRDQHESAHKRHLIRISPRLGRKMALALCTEVLAAASSTVPGLPPVPARAEAEAPIPLAPASHPFVLDGQPTAVPAANVEGTTYIGLQDLNEYLGVEARLEPNGHGLTVAVSGQGHTLTLSLGNGKYKMNGQSFYGPLAIVREDTVYLPL